MEELHPKPLSALVSAAQSSPRIPKAVWALGFVSMFMDISSEMVHALLPVFLITTLGASAVMVGVVEGAGEATASISKLFSGWFSDRLGNRKLLAAIGYALGAASKPLFALAPSASWVLAARFSDRVGKGIRGAPRDALVGDIAPPVLRGAAFGLRQALDTVGAFAGPLVAMALMASFANDVRLVFWVAIIPGIAAVAILILLVHEPARIQPAGEIASVIRITELGRLGRSYWAVVAVGVILTIARFSEAFLVLRAQGMGLTLGLIPLVLIVMNAVYAASAYPMGTLSDRMNRHTLLAMSFGVLILSDVVLALAQTIWLVMVGTALWGLHMGMSQGLLASLVTDTAPSAQRGTAFGLFNFASGVALLLASLLAGILWETVGPAATFLAGAGLTAIGLAGTMVFKAHSTVSFRVGHVFVKSGDQEAAQSNEKRL